MTEKPPMVVLTCGRVVEFTTSEIKFCGGPAMFRFVGPITVGRHETYEKALALRGQITLDLCLDHARETFVRMEPALREHSATMRCLVFSRLTIHCSRCHSLFRLEPLAPTLTKQIGRFCPNCGSAALSTLDPQLDFWEILSESIPGEIPPTLLQKIHSLWMADRTATSKFVEYIIGIQEELESGNG